MHIVVEDLRLAGADRRCRQAAGIVRTGTDRDRLAVKRGRDRGGEGLGHPLGRLQQERGVHAVVTADVAAYAGEPSTCAEPGDLEWRDDPREERDARRLGRMGQVVLKSEGEVIGDIDLAREVGMDDAVPVLWM